jgi:hypothetical protein
VRFRAPPTTCYISPARLRRANAREKERNMTIVGIFL